MTNENGMLLLTLRNLRRMTQAELARRSEVSKPYISYFENGLEPSAEHLEKLEQALGVNFDVVRPLFRAFMEAAGIPEP